MKRAALGFALVLWGAAALAQDLVITNARILDVSTDIARGSIVIEKYSCIVSSEAAKTIPHTTSWCGW